MATASKTDKETTIEDLQAQIAELKKDFVTVADTLKSLAGGEMNAAANTVREKAHAAADRAKAAANSAREQVAEATDAARETIARNPLSATAIALAVGFAVGLLARR